MEKLNELNLKVKNYTKQHKELLQSHHWQFDLPPFKDKPYNPKYMVIGINPGETDKCWKLVNEPTEESRLFDFHEHYAGKGARERLRWTQSIYKFLETREVIQTELFFWSSNDLKELEERYGQLDESPHLDFCLDLNNTIINIHNPDAIICPGLQTIPIIKKAFGLRFIEKLVADNGHRLLEHYSDGNKDWIFTKHFSGAFGFSNEQKIIIKNFIKVLK